MDAASEGHYDGNMSKESRSIGLQILLPKEQRDAKHLDIKEENLQTVTVRGRGEKEIPVRQVEHSNFFFIRARCLEIYCFSFSV